MFRGIVQTHVVSVESVLRKQWQVPAKNVGEKVHFRWKYWFVCSGAYIYTVCWKESALSLILSTGTLLSLCRCIYGIQKFSPAE
jgi:hypothetical protein